MGRGKRYDEEPKLNIKKVISVILAIAVIVMFAISLNHLLNTEAPEATGDLAYFTILENNKWGVMNSKGEVVVQPAYDEMIVIPDSTKPIFFCTYDVNFENGSYKTRVVNEKEENLFTNYETATPIDNYDEMGNIFYEEEIFRVQNDGKYGLANQEGEEIARNPKRSGALIPPGKKARRYLFCSGKKPAAMKPPANAHMRSVLPGKMDASPFAETRQSHRETTACFFQDPEQ